MGCWSKSLTQSQPLPSQLLLPLRGETQPSVLGGGKLELGKQLSSPGLFPYLWSSSTGHNDCF